MFDKIVKGIVAVASIIYIGNNAKNAYVAYKGKSALKKAEQEASNKNNEAASSKAQKEEKEEELKKQDAKEESAK